jgi:hypothetical protein
VRSIGPAGRQIAETPALATSLSCLYYAALRCTALMAVV